MRALRRLPRGAERPCGCKGRSRPRAGRLRSRLRRSVGGGFCRSPRGPLTRRVDESRGAAPEKALGEGAAERRFLRRVRRGWLRRGLTQFVFETLSAVER